MDYGYSQGNLATLDTPTQTSYLAAIRAIIGPGGVVRTGITWDPATRAAPDFARYDAFQANAKAHDLVWLPNIHTIKPSGAYVIPNYDQFKAACQAIASHYAGTITRYEVWNEPDGIGNAGDEMTPSIAAAILHSGAAGLRSGDPHVHVIGLGLAYTQSAYLDALITADPAFLSYCTALGVHLYMSLDPSKCAATIPHCVKSLPLLREWIDAHSANRPAIAVTEGGYSGTRDRSRPSNVVTERQQADWGIAALTYIEQNNAALRVSLFSPYNVVDSDTTTYDGSGADYAYWYEHLGATRSDGSLKPWGTAYHDHVSAAA